MRFAREEQGIKEERKKLVNHVQNFQGKFVGKNRHAKWFTKKIYKLSSSALSAMGALEIVCALQGKSQR